MNILLTLLLLQNLFLWFSDILFFNFVHPMSQIINVINRSGACYFLHALACVLACAWAIEHFYFFFWHMQYARGVNFFVHWFSWSLIYFLQFVITQMLYFEFVKFFDKSLKTLKISGAIKGLECFSLSSTLIRNTIKCLSTRITVTDFRIVSFWCL